ARLLPVREDIRLSRYLRASPERLRQTRTQVDPVIYQQDIDAWRAERLQKLTGPDGWTTLVGLYWLQPGSNSFGSSSDNALQLDAPGFPSQVGHFDFDGKDVSFTAAKGTQVSSGGKPVTRIKMVNDADAGTAGATTLTVGSVSFHVIKRVDRLGIRVKDSHADGRIHFQGLEYFPVAPEWRFEARFEPYRPMKKVPIINILGMEEEMNSAGALLFDVDGKQYRLETVLEDGETDYFVMFKDLSSGKQTYGAGRFLYVKPPVNGVTVLDFNKSYNPPCVFSPFATCPLPPPENWLPLTIAAGELRYAGSNH
ncbi:MAG TPA: DUF1684 domain-containing protein, partial [Gammaproteobacteria bacterium]|nr:DUF1684 domain-containing protein [Gammaproteobacteria bacterium]